MNATCLKCRGGERIGVLDAARQYAIAVEVLDEQHSAENGDFRAGYLRSAGNEVLAALAGVCRTCFDGRKEAA